MAGDSDLIVNVDLLVSSESSLKTIKNEFEGLDKRKDSMEKEWGSGQITDAMSDFVDNWEKYREELLGSIETVQKLVTSTIDSFTGLDKELADSTRKGKK
ncbi:MULTISPECIES: hypothetical protein [unclassified Streptomyces]|uniref:hypothetical protein n=1 Tax=unclassified Streptomyces TaxID=2593676 RepID=UPI00364E29C4